MPVSKVIVMVARGYGGDTRSSVQYGRRTERRCWCDSDQIVYPGSVSAKEAESKNEE